MHLLPRAGLLAAAALALASLASVAAWGGSLGTGPCQADAERLCPGTEKSSQVAACLAGHMGELDPLCQQHLDDRAERRRERAAALQAACGDEVTRLCAGLESGVRNCLREHDSELSADCRDHVAKPDDDEED
jgi:hypothetical protein